MEKAFRKVEATVHTGIFYSNDKGKGPLGADGKIARDFKSKDFFRSFSLGEKLGKGTTGKVFKATLKEAPEGTEPTTYAVKRVRRWGLRSSAKKALQREVSILHILVHKNIVDVYQFYPRDPQYSYIVLEYMGGGQLFERMTKKDSYNEQEARDICVELIDALRYCHEIGIVHRDVKSKNILLTSGRDGATIKLADFGFACSVLNREVVTPCKTPGYTAPEILLGKPHDTSVDMWSIGVVIYALLSGFTPFYDSNMTKMFLRIVAADFEFDYSWMNITSGAKDFVFRLLTANPAKRMTAAEAASHPWLHAANASLASVDLGRNLEQIKISQAKIKLRAMVKMVLMAQRLISCGKLSDSFVLGEYIGKGNFAMVFKATAVARSAVPGEGLPPPPTEYAVKRTDRKGLREGDKEGVYEEARILRELRHPNVVRMERFYDNDPQYLYMVMELMAGGELTDSIKQKTFYNEEEAQDVCRVLLGAIKYIHEKDVVHRDLKPENLLLASPNDDLSIRLADFGFACNLRGDLATEFCGTPNFIAPEILSRKAYGTSVDMWSMGVLIYLLLGGSHPFGDWNQKRMFRTIKTGRFSFSASIWSEVSDDAKDLIRNLLIVDREKRLTAAEALNHPWLSMNGPSMKGNNLRLGLESLRLSTAKRKLRAAFRAFVFAKRAKSLIRGYYEENAGGTV